MMSLLNPYAPKFVTLRTRLSPEECFRRLQPVTLPWLSIQLVIPWVTSKLPLMGWVYPTGFAVRKRTVSMIISSLQPEAKAQFVAAPDGTCMRVRLGPRRWITVSGWIGLAFMVLFVEGLMLLCRYQGNPRCREPLVFALPLVVPALLSVLQLWGWRLIRDETVFLVDFLKQTLEAEEVPEIPATLG